MTGSFILFLIFGIWFIKNIRDWWNWQQTTKFEEIDKDILKKREEIDKNVEELQKTIQVVKANEVNKSDKQIEKFWKDRG